VRRTATKVTRRGLPFLDVCGKTSDISGESEIHVTFHGVRGSTPCHGREVLRYGGNTSCVSVHAPGEQPLLFDIGTGARYFGLDHVCGSDFRGACLLSHLHWDHIQGLPFFAPMLDPTTHLTLYGPRQDDGRSVGEVLDAAIRPPVFPVTIDELPATAEFHDLGDDDLMVGGFAVSARSVPHLGPTLGYRVRWRDRVVVYISDHQQPLDGGFDVPDAVLELAAGADVLIHDAQFTAAEFSCKAHWGHCTPEFALRVAAESGVKQLVLFHHDPRRDDDALMDMALCVSQLGERVGVDVVAAAEGLTLTI
jgi:phosphoribosyl 1,2-cyclic phosphodiesterase